MSENTPFQAPAGGNSLEDPAVLAQRRAALKAELAALPPEDTIPVEEAAVPVFTGPQDNQPVSRVVSTREVTPAPEPPKAPPVSTAKPTNPFSHWLHLADGRILESLGVYGTHYDTDELNAQGTPVVAALPNPNYTPGGTLEERRARLMAELAALS
jgi:hypothetical protein